MKVLFVLNSASLGGANRSAITLMKFLKEKQVQIYVMIPENGMIENELSQISDEILICTYRGCVLFPGYKGVPWMTNLFNLPKILRKVNGWNIDIIHTNSSTHDIGFILAKILKKKHVWHVREALEVHFKARYIFPRIYSMERKETDAVVCVSNYIFELNKQKFSYENMTRIYNPFCINDYYIKRVEFAINDRIAILVAGNITKSKGQFEALQAMKLLIEKGNCNFVMRIIGAGDKTIISGMRKFILENKLDNYVQLLPFEQDLFDLRAQSDISLSCSRHEALPRVVIESMLSGLLVIGNNSGGTAEVVGNSERGFLYDGGEPEQIVNILEFVQNHKKECYEIIKTAQKYAMEKFDYIKNSNEVYELYCELLTDN